MKKWNLKWCNKNFVADLWLWLRLRDYDTVGGDEVDIRRVAVDVPGQVGCGDRVRRHAVSSDHVSQRVSEIEIFYHTALYIDVTIQGL